jgi:hypothetical protein
MKRIALFLILALSLLHAFTIDSVSTVPFSPMSGKDMTFNWRSDTESSCTSGTTSCSIIVGGGIIVKSLPCNSNSICSYIYKRNAISPGTYLLRLQCMCSGTSTTYDSPSSNLTIIGGSISMSSIEVLPAHQSPEAPINASWSITTASKDNADCAIYVDKLFSRDSPPDLTLNCESGKKYTFSRTYAYNTSNHVVEILCTDPATSDSVSKLAYIPIDRPPTKYNICD